MAHDRGAAFSFECAHKPGMFMNCWTGKYNVGDEIKLYPGTAHNTQFKLVEEKNSAVPSLYSH